MLEQAANTRALVVEDDPNIVDLIRSNLAIRGFDTVVSIDGRHALNLLETENPDIVLLDLMLPEIDGFELCQLIRERSPVRFTERIAEIAPRPLLVIAASKDAIVAPSAVHQLFETAGEPKTYELIEANHTDCAERAKFVALRWLQARGFSHSRSKG